MLPGAMAESVHTRAIRRAARYCGGLDALARRIGVSRARLGLHADGVEEAPMDVFLAVVDIILEEEVAQLGRAHPAQDSPANKPR
jgi:predicted transcriptional regulator